MSTQYKLQSPDELDETIQNNSENYENLKELCQVPWEKLSNENKEFKCQLKMAMFAIFKRHNITDHEVLNSTFNEDFTEYTLKKLEYTDTINAQIQEQMPPNTSDLKENNAPEVTKIKIKKPRAPKQPKATAVTVI